MRQASIVAVLFALLVGWGWLQLPRIRALKEDEAKAQQRVIAIVNQPIVRLSRTVEAAVFPSGWFDEGAPKPDFDNVDIRATQEFTYDRYRYVTSNLNPTEMFMGNDLEFNEMTKHFYVDYSVPKKRLSQSEMTEINQLYRVIGRDEHAIARQYILAAVVACGIMMVVYLGSLALRD